MRICIALTAMAVLLEASEEGEFCNNGCEQNKTDNWCNKRRTSSDGNVLRCVEKTRNGGNCVSDCKKGTEDHYWCWFAWHDSESWEYCGPEGQTRYGVRCISECAQRGENYWWCYTEYDRYDSSKGTKWEYCSPPGQAKKVTYTTHGQECTGDCGTQGKSYWWCKKSMRWRGGGSRGKKADDTWDYCSPQSSVFRGKTRTRYNKPCKDACETRGENYFWCNTWDDSWEYCSPKAEEQRVIAKGGPGHPCAGICDKRGESYKWCTVVSVADASKESKWSPAQNFPCGEDRRWGPEEPESGMSGWVIALIILLCALVVGFCVKKFVCK